MSVKSTVTRTRSEAIYIITSKKIEPIRKEIEFELNKLENYDLEQLLDNRYYDSEFENYIVIDDLKEEGDE